MATVSCHPATIIWLSLQEVFFIVCRRKVINNMSIEFGNQLIKLRKEHSDSQEALAEKLNISRQAIGKWERGESFPDINNLIQLGNIYDISVDELLGIVRRENVMESYTQAEEDACNATGEGKKISSAETELKEYKKMEVAVITFIMLSSILIFFFILNMYGLIWYSFAIPMIGVILSSLFHVIILLIMNIRKVKKNEGRKEIF